MATEEKENVQPAAKPADPQTMPDGLGSINVQGSSFMPAFKTFDEVFRWCDVISKSSMVPKAYKQKPADIMVAIQFGSEVGLKWLQSLQSIAVVNGTPSLYGDSVLGLVRSSGLLEDFEEWFEVDGVRQVGSFPIMKWADEGKDIVAFCRSVRKGMPHPRITTYSVNDAKRAGLWEKKTVYADGRTVESPWCTTPQRMLMFRARGWNCRDNFGDVLKGMPIYEEILDIEQPANTTDIIAAASQPNTKGVQVLEKLKEVAEERVVEVPTVTQAQNEPKTPEATTTTAPQSIPEAKTWESNQPTQEPALKQSNPTQDSLRNDIGMVERTLKATPEGQKRYQAVLGGLKIRLQSGQEPLDVIPVEQHGFYLSQLKVANRCREGT